MPSDIIAELPVIADAINFVIEISALPANAAKMIFLEPEAMSGVILAPLGCGAGRRRPPLAKNGGSFLESRPLPQIAHEQQPESNRTA